MYKFLGLVFFISILIVGILAPQTNQTQNSKREQNVRGVTNVVGKHETARVVRVIDGDTIEIENGRKVRYIGIDSPELKDKRQLINCFAKAAYERNKDLVEGKVVKLEKDVSETDRYGRLLRYVYVENIFVNEYLVKEGYANVSSYPPDVKYQKRLEVAEQEAKENKKGLWGDICESL